MYLVTVVIQIHCSLAQQVQKAGSLPFGYPNGLLAKIKQKTSVRTKQGTTNRFFCSEGCAFSLSEITFYKRFFNKTNVPIAEK